MRSWLALACVALLMGSACEDDPAPGQSSGSGAGSGTPSSTSSGMVTECGNLADTVLEGNCRDCAEGGCCAELAACDSAECEARFACEIACNDDAACIADCATTHPGGEAASAVTSCLSSGCPECASPSAICGTELSVGSPSCDACISASCCTEVDACLIDADCKLCVESGEPDLCDGNTVYANTVACFDDNCLTACGG